MKEEKAGNIREHEDVKILMQKDSWKEEKRKRRGVKRGVIVEE